MRWFLYGIGAVAALIALMAIVGAMLPRNHVATRRARFSKTPEQVFAVISGPQDWRPDDKIPYEVVESKPPSRRVTRISDPNLPFGGLWTWVLTPDGNSGCIVDVTEDGFVSNVFFRFISKFFMGHHASMDSYLKDLRKKLGD
jgi:hypothetical protein